MSKQRHVQQILDSLIDVCARHRVNIPAAKYHLLFDQINAKLQLNQQLQQDHSDLLARNRVLKHELQNLTEIEANPLSPQPQVPTTSPAPDLPLPLQNSTSASYNLKLKFRSLHKTLLNLQLQNQEIVKRTKKIKPVQNENEKTKKELQMKIKQLKDEIQQITVEKSSFFSQTSSIQSQIISLQNRKETLVKQIRTIQEQNKEEE
ncbi:Hypothetical_protein [Hexamita inflata]|uniref:Hypothetical_protein n=1 Tax=Hexamita inflata TaxID=28002 RepID=A0AA86QT12_9EUKA|nr:Hypothetical protein HINF_LOCUS51148 [Hexamita inflata]